MVSEFTLKKTKALLCYICFDKKALYDDHLCSFIVIFNIFELR